MKTTIVRYKTRPEHTEANIALIRQVYDALRSRKPAGLRYVTYRYTDGVTFVHFSISENEAENPLTSVPEFQNFVKDIKQRCEEPPVSLALTPLDSYGWKEPL
jgi:quinol monooxygenase YgiN